MQAIFFLIFFFPNALPWPLTIQQISLLLEDFSEKKCFCFQSTKVELTELRASETLLKK